MMKQTDLTIAVVDSGGRGHAIAKAFKQDSKRIARVIVMPGNAGMEVIDGIECIKADTPEKMLEIAEKEKVDLTIVGAEKYLSLGIVDLFDSHDPPMPIIGPTKEATILESSKSFTDILCDSVGIPVPEFEIFKDPAKAKQYIISVPYLMVVKCDGLAEGKGSIVCNSREEALAAVDKVFEMQAGGSWGGDSVVIQRRIYGEEVTATFITNGRKVLPLPLTRDYKPAYDDDLGPNTGGMGGYTPHPWEELIRPVTLEMAEVIIDGLKEKHGITYKGFIYLGLIFENGDPNRPVLLEINARLGDPEAELLIPRTLNFVDILLAYEDQKFNEMEVLTDKHFYCDVVLASGEVKVPGKGRYPGYPGRYSIGFPVSGLESVNNHICSVYSAGLTRNEKKELVTSGGRVLHVVGKGGTLKDASYIAHLQSGYVSFEGVRKRSDIGKKALKHLVAIKA